MITSAPRSKIASSGVIYCCPRPSDDEQTLTPEAYVKNRHHSGNEFFKLDGKYQESLLLFQGFHCPVLSEQ